MRAPRIYLQTAAPHADRPSRHPGREGDPAEHVWRRRVVRGVAFVALLLGADFPAGGRVHRRARRDACRQQEV